MSGVRLMQEKSGGRKYYPGLGNVRSYGEVTPWLESSQLATILDT